MEKTCGPAYIGTLETALPCMAGSGKICPMLAQSWGGEECWGRDAPSDMRWQCVLSSGCPEGYEIRRVWNNIQKEANDSAGWLGEEVPSILATPVEGIGNGSESGSTRGKIVEAIENTHAKILAKALMDLRPKSIRAAWAWRQRDKISSAWLLAIPGYETSLSNAEFSEASASNLCLPSPSCIGRVGDVVKGRVTVDKYGDNIQATALPGDHWRIRHNAMLHLIHRLCIWAGLPVEIEVFNLFSRLIRQEGLSRSERSRHLQGLIPDLRITLPSVAGGGEGRVGSPGIVGGLPGQSRAVLHELKVISSSRTRYRPSWQRRAVDVRSSLLQGEYLAKSRAADRRQGVPVGEIGRVEDKLISLGEVQGIVCGQFGEVSEATHVLVSALADSRVHTAGVSRGRNGYVRSDEAERAIAVSAIRRRLGVMAVRCQASSLLGRLERLGPGGQAASGRRNEAIFLERKYQLETKAHSLASKQGWRVLRSGFAKLD